MSIAQQDYNIISMNIYTVWSLLLNKSPILKEWEWVIGLQQLSIYLLCDRHCSSKAAEIHHFLYLTRKKAQGV